MFKLFFFAVILVIAAASPAPQPAPAPAPAPEPKPGAILAPAYSATGAYIAPAIAYQAYTPLTYGAYIPPVWYRPGVSL